MSARAWGARRTTDMLEQLKEESREVPTTPPRHPEYELGVQTRGALAVTPGAGRMLPVGMIASSSGEQESVSRYSPRRSNSLSMSRMDSIGGKVPGAGAGRYSAAIDVAVGPVHGTVMSPRRGVDPDPLSGPHGSKNSDSGDDDVYGGSTLEFNKHPSPAPASPRATRTASVSTPPPRVRGQSDVDRDMVRMVTPRAPSPECAPTNVIPITPSGP